MTITVTTYAPSVGLDFDISVNATRDYASPRFCSSNKWSIEMDIFSGATKLVFMNPFSSEYYDESEGLYYSYCACLTGHVVFYDSGGAEIGSEVVNLPDPGSSYEVAIPSGAVKAVFHIDTYKPIQRVRNPSTTATRHATKMNTIILFERVIVVQEQDDAGNLVEEYQIDVYAVFFPIVYGRKEEMTGSTNTVVYDASFSNIGDHTRAIGLYYREAKNVRITCTVYDEKDREITHYTVDHADSIHDVEEELMTDDAISSVTNPDTGAPYSWSDVRKITLKVEVIDSAKDASLDADWIFITKA